MSAQWSMDISDLSVPQSSNISNVIRMDSSHTSLLFLYIHINTVGWWTTFLYEPRRTVAHRSSCVSSILLLQWQRYCYQKRWEWCTAQRAWEIELDGVWLPTSSLWISHMVLRRGGSKLQLLSSWDPQWSRQPLSKDTAISKGRNVFHEKPQL